MEIENRLLLSGRHGRAALAGQIKIADFIIRRRAIPHQSLGIAEEFAHGELRMWKRIFDHLPRFCIEAPNYVHIVRVVPKITVSMEAQRIQTGIPASREK